MPAHSLTPDSIPESIHRAAFEEAPVGIAYSTPDGRMVEVNGALCTLLEADRAALISRDLREWLHPHDELPDRAAWSRLLSGDIQTVRREQLLLHPDGRTVRTRLRRSVLRDAAGRVAFVVSMLEAASLEDDLFEAQLQAQAAQLEEQAAELEERTAELEEANGDLHRALHEAEQARRLAEQAEAEERAVIAGMRDVLLVLDIDGRYVKVPVTSSGLLYAPEGDLIGKRMHDIMPAAEADGFLRIIRRSLESGDPVRMEYSLDIEGRAVWFAAVVSPVGVDRVIWVARDVTEQREAAEALRESERRYRMLFDGNPMPMWVYERGTLRFLDVNEAAISQYGYSRDEFMRMTVDQIRPPEDLDAFRVAVAESPLQLHRSGGWRHRRKDGSIVDVEITAHPFDDSGRTGELILAHDVTQRRRAEAALRDSTTLLQAVVDDSPLAIVTTDRDLAITRWNPAAERMLGWSAGEMRGRHYDSLIPSDRTERYPDAWEHALSDGAFATFGTYYRHRDGSRVDVDISVAGLHDHEGRITGAMLILADTTEQRRLESQLRQSQKMEAVGQLAGGVAHDFNNLLTAITGFSDLLLADTTPGEARHDDLMEIRQATDRAAALTRQLLAFSRQQVVQPVALSLNETVTGVRKMLRRLVREDIDICVDLQQALDLVEADPGQMEQVLVNLVLNARDATTAGGQIKIGTSNVRIDETNARQPDGTVLEKGEYVRLTVSDTGSGMPPEVLARIFEPFFTTKAMGTGTGLGLATVYGIVAQSNGHIGCMSARGRGTLFTIHLPRVAGAAPAAASAAASAAREPTAIARGSGVILLVEDEDAVRAVGSRVLARAGYTVIEAHGGDTALRLIADGKAQVDLVVTDMVMPGMSGFELVGHLRERQPGLRVLYVSGYSRDAIDHKVAFDSQNGFLEKPFTADRLTAAVSRLIGTPDSAAPSA